MHARIAALEAQGFPTPDLESLATTPSDVVEARAEARRLIATLDGPTRELIYRLSLTLQALPLQQVLAIARQPAPIGEPGLVFDGLVGPWVEVVAEGLYRVSPLLREVGKDVQGEDWATGMHCGIARALLGFRTLSPTDVSAILFHGSRAGTGPPWRAYRSASSDRTTRPGSAGAECRVVRAGRHWRCHAPGDRYLLPVPHPPLAIPISGRRPRMIKVPHR